MIRELAINIVIALSVCGIAFAQETNPPSPGFDAAGSDARAIVIADEVMKALGGRIAWDATHYVTWRFFGKRLHVWDKWTGNIRVEVEDKVILMNINTGEGRAWSGGVEITVPDELATSLQDGREYWINDAYWMFMPYKLKDDGVTLKYAGRDTTQDGRKCDVLQLAFANVGVTPDNKYRIYVDDETRLVTQWDYFESATDTEPRFTTPWANWKRYGAIMLSNDRGRSKHTAIGVFREMDTSVFESPDPAALD